MQGLSLLVEEGGFEPPKRNATDLQSAPFGHSGTPPYEIGAGRRIRTPDLLITNQLLYRLSYTSVLSAVATVVILTEQMKIVNTIFRFFKKSFSANQLLINLIFYSRIYR